MKTVCAFLAFPYFVTLFALLTFNWGPSAGNFESAMMMGTFMGSMIAACVTLLLLDDRA